MWLKWDKQCYPSVMSHLQGIYCSKTFSINGAITDLQGVHAISNTISSCYRRCWVLNIVFHITSPEQCTIHDFWKIHAIYGCWYCVHRLFLCLVCKNLSKFCEAFYIVNNNCSIINCRMDYLVVCPVFHEVLKPLPILTYEALNLLKMPLLYSVMMLTGVFEHFQHCLLLLIYVWFQNTKD